MSLVITTEPREARQLSVSIQVPKERVNRELQKAANKISQQYGVPGFRRGKAPYQMVVRRYGAESLYNEFVSQLGEEVYKTAVDEKHFIPYATAQLVNVAYEPELTYQLLVPMEPVIKLGDYRSLRIEPEAPVIDEAKVDEQIEQYRAQYADWHEVERPSQYNDMITLDVKSYIVAPDGSQGETVLEESDWQVTLDQENPLDPPGLDGELVGLSKDESKEFDLSYPEESQSIHAGKPVHFQVSIKKIESYEKPALDDALAQQVGPEFQTLDDLRNSIRNALSQAESNRVTNEFVEKTINAVAEISTVEYPSVVVEDQLDGMVNDLNARLRQMGIEDPSWYYKQVGQTEEQYRESIRETAEKIARQNLIISELINSEKLEISDDELDQQIESMTATSQPEQQESAQQMAASLRQGQGRMIITSQLLHQKAIDRLLAIVKGEEVPEPGSAAASTTMDAAADGEQEGADEDESAEAPTLAQSMATLSAGRGQDDLTVIEGIGHKTSDILASVGLTTFAQLAATSVEQLKEILSAANLRISDPTTWPQQAALAAAGQWDELKTLQDKLVGGRVVG